MLRARFIALHLGIVNGFLVEICNASSAFVIIFITIVKFFLTFQTFVAITHARTVKHVRTMKTTMDFYVIVGMSTLETLVM